MSHSYYNFIFIAASTTVFEHHDFELFDSSHFGVRPHLSTSRAMSNTLRYIFNNIDNGSVVVSIILDFANGSDWLGQEILLKKNQVWGEES